MLSYFMKFKVPGCPKSEAGTASNLAVGSLIMFSWCCWFQLRRHFLRRQNARSRRKQKLILAFSDNPPSPLNALVYISPQISIKLLFLGRIRRQDSRHPSPDPLIPKLFFTATPCSAQIGAAGKTTPSSPFGFSTAHA